jgi:hypothetical protein
MPQSATALFIRCSTKSQLRSVIREAATPDGIVLPGKFANLGLSNYLDTVPVGTQMLVDTCLDDFFGWADADIAEDKSISKSDLADLVFFGQRDDFKLGKKSARPRRDQRYRIAACYCRSVAENYKVSR